VDPWARIQKKIKGCRVGLIQWRQTKEKPNRDLAKKCKMLVETQGEENVFALAKVSSIQGGT
jgi:hypothetical protein